MDFSTEELRTIAAHAEPIPARIQNGHYSTEPTEESSKIARKLRELYSDNPTLTFEQRFRDQIPDDRDLEEYLSFERLDDDDPLPEWAHAVRRIVVEFDTRYVPPEELPDRISSSPFGTLLYPIADLLTDRMERRELLDSEIFDGRVQGQIEDAFVGRVSWFTSQALHLEFQVFRQRHGADEESLDPDSMTLFERFRQYQAQEGFADTLMRYPMAARYLGLAVLQWSNWVNELLTRIETDYDEIRNTFGLSADDTISGIRVGEGDFHNEGRSVTRLEFDSGRAVYYKPRDTRIEDVYNRLCEYITDIDDFEHDLIQLDVLSKDRYGYVEEIGSRALTGTSEESQAELERYYRRMGGILCLTYLTNTTDLHYENVLTDGEHPCIVDCETLFTRDVIYEYFRTGHSHQKIMGAKLSGSVLNSRLLPYTTSVESGSSYGRSGIAQTQAVETKNQIVRWKHTNTDAMEYAVGHEEVQPESNAPRVDGGFVSPSEYIDDLITGFEAVYEHFQDVANPVERVFDDVDLNEAESRYLLRDTGAYAGVLQSMIAPNRLGSAGMTLLATEQLIKDADKLNREGYREFFPLFESEQESVNRLDIPRFGIDGTDVTEGDDVIVSSMFEKDNVDVLRRNVSDLSETDKREQVELIKATLQESP